MSDFLHAFDFIGQHTSLIWRDTVATIWLSAAGLAIAVAIAVPIGVWLGHLHRFSFAAINLSNVGRALPSLAVVSVLIEWIGIGNLNVILALVVLAVPPILTNAYVGVEGVEADAVEAARGMGMRGSQVLRRVELPLALPLIFAGMRTAGVYVVATTTIGAIAGGDGLGEIIFNPASYGARGVIAASMVVAVVALLVDVLFGALQRLVTPRGLRRGAEPAVIGPPVETTT